MTKHRIATLTAASLICAAWCGSLTGGGKNVRYASERTAYPFVGATQVVLDDFEPSKDAASAMLTLDKNDVTYSTFGEPRITALSFKSFPVKLTRVEIEDPTKKGRRIFAVELPKEMASDLGKNSLRLVTGIGQKSELAGVRLLLVNREDRVIQTLELRPMSN